MLLRLMAEPCHNIDAGGTSSPMYAYRCSPHSMCIACMVLLQHIVHAQLIVCFPTCVLLYALAQGWGTFKQSKTERWPTRRNITGVVWNDEWHAIRMLRAVRGESKKARCRRLS